MKKTVAGLIAAASILTGIGVTTTVAAGTASACTYHVRLMFGDGLFDGYGAGPQQAQQNAFKKARAMGYTGTPTIVRSGCY